MPTYLSPGVYVEEVEAGSRPIEGVGTAVAAFVGLAARGPTNTPTLVTNWSQFVTAFGDFMEGAYLAHAVYGYFLNGGGAAYVVRIGGDAPAATARAEIPTQKDAKLSGYRISALDPGPGGNQITVEVTRGDDAPRRTPSSSPCVPRVDPEEVYDDVSTKRGKNNVVTMVKEQSKLITVEEVGSAAHRAIPGAWPGHPRRRRERQADAPHPGRLRGRPRRPDRFRWPGGRRRGHDAGRARPHEPVPEGRHRRRGRPGGAVGDDRPLRADGRPGGHPRCAARPQCPAGQGVAGRQGRLRLQVRLAVLAVGQGPRPAHGQGRLRAAERPRGRRLGTQRRHRVASTRRRPTRSSAARWAWSCSITKGEHDQLNPEGINCIRAFPGRGIRDLGRPDAVERSVLAIPQRSAAVQLHRGVDPRGHPVGRLRAQRHGPLGARQADAQRVPHPHLAGRRAVRGDTPGSVLRQVRLRDQPARGGRCRPARGRDRDRARQARRVRGLPHRAVLRRGIARANRRD